MNNFIEIANNRRSVREFKNEKIDEKILDQIFTAMLKTATSMFSQQASVIRITDPEQKLKISKVCNQEYIATAPELLIFVADHYRNLSLLHELGIDETDRKNDVDMYFQGVYDSILMVQNAANIIDSFGLGSVFLGSILNDVEKIIEILELPKMTMPIIGLAFGKPKELPNVKPKLNKELRIFENKYDKKASYKEFLQCYNNELHEYYVERGADQNVDDFYKHLANNFTKFNPKRNALLTIAKKNGYILD